MCGNLPIGLASSIDHLASVCPERRAHPFRNVNGWHPACRRRAHWLSTGNALGHLLATDEIALASGDPLIQFRLVDPTIEIHDEAQPHSVPALDKLAHREVELLELPSSNPVQRERVEAADECHAVNDDDIGTCPTRELGQRDSEAAARKPTLEEA
eukprot:scaffold264482_cov33-Tisochrysis_lutea.AAC.1